MLNDTETRKRLALELLAQGLTTGRICEEMGIKRSKLRLWKTGDDRFRAKWNDLMNQLGRLFEHEEER